MKKGWVTVLVMCSCMVTFSQPVQTLRQRLSSFMQANNSMNLEKVLDYTYPKLFELAPRGQMLELLKNSFNNEQMTVRLDSLRTDSIYPVFSMQGGSYAKILYSMHMIMQLKDTTTDADKKSKNYEALIAVMQTQFGEKKVAAGSSGNIVVQMNAAMVAVKDRYAKEWCFVNLKPNDPVASQLFSKEIIDKLASYK